MCFTFHKIQGKIIYDYMHCNICCAVFKHGRTFVAGAIEKTALDWNPQGYRRRGRPKSMWQRIIEDEKEAQEDYETRSRG